MRHYEIVIMVHPDQSNQVESMVERYKTQITEAKGLIHRHEDWGRRQLAYPIDKIHKAHYVMLNLECTQDTLDELGNAFKYNDAIIRHLIMKRKAAITGQSAILKADEEAKSARNKESSESSSRDAHRGAPAGEVQASPAE